MSPTANPSSAKGRIPDNFQTWKMRLHERFVNLAFDQPNSTDLEQTIQLLIQQEDLPLSRAERELMVQELKSEIEGYGPLDVLLRDNTVSEIMVNGPYKVYVERSGRVELTPVVFANEAHVMRIIEKIVSPLGRRIDESSPMVDARLPDGSRVNAIIPPLAITGPTLTIRKFSRDPLQANDLVRFGTLTEEMVEFLQGCVQARLNILVSGGTGAGKTTTLNVVSSFIPTYERVITVEDAAEVQLHQDHVVTLETRPPNIENKGAVTIRDLVRNTLRMRPDRIIVGEVRGAEALDMLQAMNTGHDGSLTTVHANSPRDALRRIEVMVLMTGMELPLRAIREQISSAIHLVVQQARLKDGTRKIVQISELVGMEGDNIVLQDLFVFEEQGLSDDGAVLGHHHPTGVVPRALDLFKARGIPVKYEWFQTGADPWQS
ncbi:CpaF family protein [Alicyclobacillaceae bacterium I2511]|nr:CpaF family protein [Alicyclobacillaceae bacterium I2511]